MPGPDFSTLKPVEGATAGPDFSTLQPVEGLPERAAALTNAALSPVGVATEAARLTDIGLGTLGLKTERQKHLPGIGGMMWALGGMEPGSGYAAGVDPAVEIQRRDLLAPIFPIPELKGKSTLGKVGAGTFNILKQIPEMMESQGGPLLGMTGPATKLGDFLMKLAFGATVTQAAAQQAGKAWETGDVQDWTETGLSTLLGGLLARSSYTGTKELMSPKPTAPAGPEVEVVPPQKPTPPPVPPKDPGIVILEQLVKEGTLPPDVLEPGTTPITRKVPDVREKIADLEKEVRSVGPGELDAMRQAKLRFKLTDGQYMRVLEEWSRRRAEKAKAPPTQPTTPGRTPIGDKVGLTNEQEQAKARAETERLRLEGERQRQALVGEFGPKGKPLALPAPLPTPSSQPPPIPHGVAPPGQREPITPEIARRDLRPAVQLPNGKLAVGEQGQTHAEILAKNGYPDENVVPHESPGRGFVLASDPNTLIPRKPAAAMLGVEGTAKAGGLDSQDLPGGERTGSPGAPPSEAGPTLTGGTSPDRIKQLRQEVEADSAFLHRMNNATMTSLNFKTRQRAMREAKQIQDAWMSGDKEGAEQRLSALEAENEMHGEVTEEGEPLQSAIRPLQDLRRKLFGPSTKERQDFIRQMAFKYPDPIRSHEGRNMGLDVEPIEEIAKFYGKDWRIGVQDYLNEVRDFKRQRGAEEVTAMRPEQQPAPPLRPGELPPNASPQDRENLQFARQLSGANIARSMDLLGASMYDKSQSATVVKELVQNAYDGVQGVKDPTIRFDIESAVPGNYDTENQRVIIIADNGKGMSPEVIATKLLPAFESGKSAETSAGGYGLAKIAFLGGAEKFEFDSVTDMGDGTKLRSTLTGTGPDWFKFVNTGAMIPENINVPGEYEIGGMKLVVETAERDAETGTTAKITIPKEKWQRYEATHNFERIAENEPGTVKFLRYGNEVPGAIKNVAKSVETPGATIQVLFDDTKPPVRQYHIPVMNRGLYQFDIGMTEDVKIPPLRFNVIPKADVTDESYPYTANRDALKGKAREVVDQELDRIAETYKQKILGRFQETMKATQQITKNQRFLDVSGKMDEQVVRNIATHPTLQAINRIFAANHDKMFRLLNQRYGDYWSKANYSGLANFGQAMSDDPTFGVRFGSTAAGTPGEIYYDLGSILNKVAHDIGEGRYTMDEFTLAFGERSAGVMLHEIAHQISHYEGETHAKAMTSLGGLLAERLFRTTNELVRNIDPNELKSFYEWYTKQTAEAKVSESEKSDFLREAQRQAEKGPPDAQLSRASGAADVSGAGEVGERGDVTAPRPTQPTATTLREIRDSIPDESRKQQFDALGLDNPDLTALGLMQNMAKGAAVFGKDQAALADFLVRHHDSTLMTTGLDLNPGPHGRAGYNYKTHKVYLEANPRGTAPSLGENALHEATHAATHWQVMFPKTPTQRAAAATIWDLLEQTKQRLPENVRKFWEENYKPIWDKGPGTNEEWDAVNTKANQELGHITHGLWQDVMYSLRSPSEFIAMALGNPAMRSYLKTWRYQKRTAWESFKDTVKDILGIRKDTALDRTLDAVIELGVDKGQYDLAFPGYRKILGVTPGMGDFFSAPPTNPTTVSTIHDVTFGDRIKQFANRIAGYSAPKTLAVSEDTANKLVRYASSRIAAPLVARSLATEVLGKHWNDPRFSTVLGAVVVEDQLRGVKQGFLDAAAKTTDPAERQEFLDMANKVVSMVGRPNSPLRAEIQFQTLLQAPAIKEAVERHKRLLQPIAEQAHTQLGGKDARGGENTGAFANLIAILNPDDVESVRGMVFGSRQGDITNPLKRGSVFSKQRRGTAEQGYVIDYRTIAERMIRGNYEQKALRDTYDSYVNSGLAVEEKAGVAPPKTLGGKPTEKVTVEMRGAGPGQTRIRNLWVRQDVAPELRQALATDSKFERGAVRMVLDAINTVQIVGLTDAVWHTFNMVGSIVTAQGGRNILVDAARKMPGLNLLDAGARIVHNAIRVGMDHPDIQKELAQLSEIGAGRSELVHRTGISKAVGAMGVPDPMNPLLWSSYFIRLIDKAGRITLNEMFNNLVNRKLVEDSEFNRREFINRMGQYNSRLMNKYQDVARELSLSSFIVAGKNFNRLARQKLLWDPGVKALDAQAWAKMHLIEGLGWTTALVVLPVLANKALTGTLYGRPGTPIGAIDTGRDDKQGRPIVIDPLQTILLRRGLRITGMQALARGVLREQPAKKETLVDGLRRAMVESPVRDDIQWKETMQNMLHDIWGGILHPWAGPAVRTFEIGRTGYDPNGYLVSRNPDDSYENLFAALKNANPMISAYLRGVEQQTGGGKELVTSFGGAVGVKKGKLPDIEAKYEAMTGHGMGEASLPERRKVQRAIDKERAQQPNLNIEAQRKAAVRNVLKNFARQDAIRSELSEPNRKWLDSNRLHLPGFSEELTLDREKLPLTHKEAERFMALVTRHYDERIEALRGSKLIEKWKADGVLQKRLGSRLTLARERARAELKHEIYQRSKAQVHPTAQP